MRPVAGTHTLFPAIGVGGVLGLVALCQAVAWAEPGVIRFPAGTHMQVVGVHPGDRAGAAVAGIGDFNGDRIPDVAVGAPGTRAKGRGAPGAAYVVFGRRRGPSTVRLAALGHAGMRIAGARSGDRLGTSVAAIGDVNRDGLSDVALGAPGVDRGTHRDAGAVYVLFGSRRAGGVRIDRLGAGGLEIFGTQTYAGVGDSISGSGDVNGDGIPDMALGLLEQRASRTPTARVVLGPLAAGTAPVDSARLRGFQASAPGPRPPSGRRLRPPSRVPVAGVGDVNGDRLDDVAFGDPGGGPFQPSSLSAYVAFGRRKEGSVTTSGGNGFVVFSPSAGFGPLGFGFAVTGRVDATGDSVSDIWTSDVRSGGPGGGETGSVYAFSGRGRAEGTNVTAIDGLLRLREAEPGDALGWSLTVAPDTAGRPGWLVAGAPGRRAKSCRRTGALYMVPLPLRRATTELADSREVHEVVGRRPEGALGQAVADAGDMTGDRVREVVVGAPGWESERGRALAGSAYVLTLPRTRARLADTVGPRLCVRRPALSATRLARRSRLAVSASVDEAATVDARATLRTPDSRLIVMDGRAVSLAGSGRALVELRVPSEATRAARPGARLKLEVWARDRSGNVSRREWKERLER